MLSASSWVAVALWLAAPAGALAKPGDAAQAQFEMFKVPLPTAEAKTAEPSNYPPLRPLEAAASPGVGVARTMALLTGSTAQRRNHVRVLVYGQSLSKQSWAERVRQELVRRYPHAILEFHNRSIGGFVSTMLKRTVEHDVIPLYPDLVILHDFGGEDDYEEVIRQIRTRTTAEMLVQNDPLTPAQDAKWHDQHSWQWMPALAARWGIEVVDVRTAWAHYVQDQNLKVEQLLARDKGHLNDRGNFVWAEATLRHLVPTQAFAVTSDKQVKTVRVGADISWRGQKLVVPFTGNRIDVIAAPGGPVGAACQVIIDGKAPSQIPALYTFSRPNADANRDWPWQTGAIIHVDNQSPLLLESWRVVFTSFTSAKEPFKFDVIGSRTGFDGSGESTTPFVSQSGRVVLSPDDWFIERVVGRPHANVIAPGYQVTFHVQPQFADTYVAPPTPDASREYIATLAQGLSPGRHTLELVAPARSRPAIAAVRVYSPMTGPATAAR